MFDNNWREQLPAKIRVMQVIVGAMSFGCLSFLIIVIIVSQNFKKAPDQPILTYIGLLMAASMFAVWIVLPNIIVQQGRKKILENISSSAKQASENSANDKQEQENSKAQMLIGLLQTKIISSCAVLEGAVFFLLIVYLVEHSMICMYVAVAILLLLVAQMPTTGRAEYWVEDQLKLVDM